MTKEDLIKKRNELQDEINSINNKIIEFNKKELSEKMNLKIGEEVTVSGKKAKIIGNDGSFFFYSIYKKDGELGSIMKRIWDSDKIIKH